MVVHLSLHSISVNAIICVPYSPTQRLAHCQLTNILKVTLDATAYPCYYLRVQMFAHLVMLCKEMIEW